MAFPMNRRLPRLGLSSLLLLTVLLGCDSNQGAPVPTSWATQLSLAQKAAKQIDGGAILENVRAVPAGTPTKEGVSETLEVSFIFLRASPEAGTDQQGLTTEMLVSLEDTSPTSTLRTLRYLGEVSPGPTTKEREKLAEALASVQLSPAEVLSATLQEGRKYSEQHNVVVDPFLNLTLQGTTLEELNVPAVWKIAYRGGTNSLLSIYVDARTGQILKREEN